VVSGFDVYLNRRLETGGWLTCYIFSWRRLSLRLIFVIFWIIFCVKCTKCSCILNVIICSCLLYS